MFGAGHTALSAAFLSALPVGLRLLAHGCAIRGTRRPSFPVIIQDNVRDQPWSGECPFPPLWSKPSYESQLCCKGGWEVPWSTWDLKGQETPLMWA